MIYFFCCRKLQRRNWRDFLTKSWCSSDSYTVSMKTVWFSFCVLSSSWECVTYFKGGKYFLVCGSMMNLEKKTNQDFQNSKVIWNRVNPFHWCIFVVSKFSESIFLRYFGSEHIVLTLQPHSFILYSSLSIYLLTSKHHTELHRAQCAKAETLNEGKVFTLSDQYLLNALKHVRSCNMICGSCGNCKRSAPWSVSVIGLKNKALQIHVSVQSI